MTERKELTVHNGEKHGLPYRVEISGQDGVTRIDVGIQFKGDEDFTPQAYLEFNDAGTQWEITVPELRLKYMRDGDVNVFSVGLTARRDNQLSETAQIRFESGKLVKISMENHQDTETRYMANVDGDKGKISLQGGMDLFQYRIEGSQVIGGTNMDRDSTYIGDNFIFFLPEEMNKVMQSLIDTFPKSEAWSAIDDERVRQIGEIVFQVSRLLIFAGTPRHGQGIINDLNMFIAESNYLIS